jgi:hypothetical protein
VSAADAELVAAAGEERELVDHGREDERVVVREEWSIVRKLIRRVRAAAIRTARTRSPRPRTSGRRVLDRGVGVVAEPVGVLDLLEHLAVEPVVRLPGQLCTSV